jgi:hypothetical protein
LVSRRHFIKYGTLTVSVLGTAPAFLRGQDLHNHVHVAVVGAGGKGSSDTDHAAKAGGDIVALCDVDQGTLSSRGAKYPQAKLFKDFRKMLEQMERSIEAVVVSAPDHIHAPACIMAMRMGKHIYCQKPLTHSVYEARTMRELARKKKLATQMGNQGSAGNGLRRAVEVIHAGVIGKPRELHVWSNRPIWPQGLARPAGEDAVPETLNWDLFLGPAPLRPFKKDTYHPFKWRGWKDFGTGALGDMACHTVNMPFRALKLGYPNVVECEAVSDLYPETYPKTSRIRFEFPAREGLPPLKFWWYDGSPDDKSVTLLRPPETATSEILDLMQARTDREGNQRPRQLPPSGALIIGDKGKIFSPDDYGSTFYALVDNEKKFTFGRDHEACKAVPQTIPRNDGPGGDDERQKSEWFRMIRDGVPAFSNFEIAAYLTEIILLGCVALNVGVGRRLDWDGPKMRARNTREADPFVRPKARKGWNV